MPDRPTAGPRISRTAAAGVTERHTGGCAGSVTKAGKVKGCTCTPTLRAAVSLGSRGHRRRFSATFSTLADALVWVEDVKRADRNGEEPDEVAPMRAAVPTIREASVTFTERMVTGEVLARGGMPYSDATIENYAGSLTRDVLPFVVERFGVPLGDLPANVVDTRTIEAMAESVAAGGRRAAQDRARKARKAGRTIGKSNGTAGARIAVAALRQVLADLYRRGMIDAIPAAPATMPAPPRSRDRRLDHDQADVLVLAAYADDQRLERSILGPYVLLSSRTGARRGELRGLVWGPKGLDLAGGTPTISIARETTKTEAGARTIALDAETARAMKAHRLANGRPADGLPVFADPKSPSRPVGPDLLRAGFGRINKVTGIEAPGTHLMRHSVASWAVEGGMDHVEVAARLGHRDAAFTVRTYAHPDRDRIAREPLDLPFPKIEGI
jgi:integrase